MLLSLEYEVAGQRSELTNSELLDLRRAVPADIVNLLELETVVLYLLARENPMPGVVCELGSYMGGSVIPLALGAARSKHSNTVIAVDDHEWHRHAVAEVDSSLIERLPSTLPIFEQNLELAGVADRVRTVVSDTAAAAARVDSGVSLLLVDAGHDERSLRADIRAWLPKIAGGGIAAFHDYRNSAWPDVERIVDQLRADFTAFTALQTLALGRIA